MQYINALLYKCRNAPPPRAGPVKRPEFDEQTFPVHFDCLAAISTSRLF